MTFAEAVTNVGIIYDYNPSESPMMLASRVDSVFAGHLTGGFDDDDAEGREPGMSSIAYEVEVDKVVHGEVAAGDRVNVAMEYNPTMRPAKVFEDAAVAGVNVVVFAAEWPGRTTAELLADLEGFATACENDKPIGRRGKAAAWQQVPTLPALTEAADQATDRVEVRLWHCGVGILTFEDRRWEVPDGQDPFDATNVEQSFAFRGTITRVAADELRYVDDAGLVLRFVPDNGSEEPCA